MSEQVVRVGKYGIAKLSDCKRNYMGQYEIDPIQNGYETNVKNYHVYLNYNLITGSGRSAYGTDTDLVSITRTSQHWYSHTVFYYRFVLAIFGDYKCGRQGSESSQYGYSSPPSISEVWGSAYLNDSFPTAYAYLSTLEKEGGDVGCVVSVYIYHRQTWTHSWSYPSQNLNGDYWTASNTWRAIIDYTFTQEQYNNAGCLHFGGEKGVYYRAAIVDTNRYRVKHWKIGNTTIGGTEGALEINPTLPSSDAIYTCVFEQFQWRFVAKSNVEESIGTVTGAMDGFKEFDSVIPLTATCIDTENYRFDGWWVGYGENLDPSACNLFYSSNETISYVMTKNDTTIVAKFVSRKTHLVVNVNESSGGAVSVIVNNETVAESVTEWSNEDARDGWALRLIAKPKERFYFKYWKAPLGATGTQNIYEKDFATDLLPREENKFEAFFEEKRLSPINCTLVSRDENVPVRGYVAYSGELSSGGTFTHENDESSPYITNDLYSETDYSFVANEYPDEKLYQFIEWQVKVGDDWYSAAESMVAWVKAVDGNKIIINVADSLLDDKTEEAIKSMFYLRAVYAERPTYTIKELSVQGGHEIFRNRLAKYEGCFISGLPEPHKEVETTIDGETVLQPYWVEGTTFELKMTPGSKWRALRFDLAYAIDDAQNQETVNSASVSIVLDKDYDYIRGIFEAMKYKVNAIVDENSKDVGETTFEYASGLDALNNIEYTETNEETEVWVDTEVRLHAKVKSPYVDAVDGDGNVKFTSWSRNDIGTSYGQNHNVVCNGTSIFKAYFSAKTTIIARGSYLEDAGSGTVEYPLGDVSIDAIFAGVAQTIIIPRDYPTYEEFLICGSTFSLGVLPRQFETAGGLNVQGFLSGWYEKNIATQEETLIRGWGLNIKDLVVTKPRELIATFVKENRWPILSLRHSSDVEFCTFELSGQRSERSQDVGDSTVVLTNRNDFFVDSYGTVQVGLNVFDSSFRFQYWVRKEFARDKDGNKLFDDDGNELFVNEEIYATTQSISVYMTSDVVLTPIFFTGSPIMVEARLSSDTEQTFGDVVIESEVSPIEVYSDSRKAFAEGDAVTFVASPRNLYRFDGWYQDASCTVLASKMPRFEVVVDEAKTYYARFVQDTNAIYTFGTSKTNKTMCWKSKRLNLVAPASFSVAQVDAEGYKDSNGNYTVSLSVHHASSPEVPVRMETYTIKDSNSRRLAFGKRNEKLYEFELMSSTPINWAVFSTSVMGITGGAQQ